jgi:hypothetical protein
VVGAADRNSVHAFLAGLPGADVGVAGPVEPAPPEDERVDVVVRVLQTRHWREQSLDRLCADLVSALDTWQDDRNAWHLDLRRLLEER